MNLSSEAKNSPLRQIHASSSNYLENMFSVSVFHHKTWCDTLKTKGCHGNILSQWLLTKDAKLTVKGVKLKSESFFSLWRFGAMKE